MAYAGPKQKEDAFSLYCEGIPMSKIASAVGVSKPTVYDWKKKYDWVKRGKNILISVKEQFEGNLTNRKVARLEYYKYLQEVSKSNVKRNPKIVSPRVGLEATKMELLETGEATERSEVKSVDTFKEFLKVKGKKGKYD